MRRKSERTDRMGRSLSRAFHDQPNFTHLLPDDARRPAALAWFFGRFVIGVGLRKGAVHVAENGVGGAVWIEPGATVTGWDALRAGMLSMPMRFGPGGMSRSMRLNGHLEKVRRTSAPSGHWYLLALGVDPSHQGQGLGSALIQPVLSHADRNHRPCYLETFNDQSLRFYETHGFERLQEGRAPSGGPRYWTMARRPQPTSPNRTHQQVT